MDAAPPSPPPPSAPRTARERARADLTEQILRAARAQLATSGAAALSLRAVARELGMVSSAVYRYVATRDELLTALIASAYDSLGEAVEAAAAPGRGRTPRSRFTAAARALRAWAGEHPHEHALLYGSPVPGYTAPPERTNAPGARVPLALVGLVALGAAPARRAPAALDRQARAVVDELGLGAAPEVLVEAALVWSALSGAVWLERTGQLRGSFDPAGPLFDHLVAELADRVGL